MKRTHHPITSLTAAIAILLGVTVANALPITSGLEFDFAADAGVTTSGTEVTGWASQAGAYSAARGGYTSVGPQYVTDSMNGLPILRFNGTDSGLRFAGYDTSIRDMSLFVVYTAGAGNGTRSQPVYAQGFNWAYPTFTTPTTTVHPNRPNTFTLYDHNENYYSSPSTASDPRLGESHFTYGSGGNDQFAMGLNGDSANFSVNLTNWPTTQSTHYIGHNGQPSFWTGDLAQLVLYDRRLNSAEQTIVRNHLAAKWGVTLDSTDVYAGASAAKGDYDFDVFGIGAGSDGKVSSGSAAGLTITEDASSLADGDYLLAGHKVESNGWTTADALFGLERWERVWYLDKTGDLDAVLSFDFNEAGLGAPEDEKYALIYSAANAFSFSIVAIREVNGGQVSYSLGNSQLLDGYYTIQAVPEPTTVTLLALAGIALLRRRR